MLFLPLSLSPFLFYEKNIRLTLKLAISINLWSIIKNKSEYQCIQIIRWLPVQSNWFFSPFGLEPKTFGAVGQPLYQCAMQSKEKERVSISAASLAILIWLPFERGIFVISSIIVQSRQKNFMYMLDQQYFFGNLLYYIYHIS